MGSLDGQRLSKKKELRVSADPPWRQLLSGFIIAIPTSRAQPYSGEAQRGAAVGRVMRGTEWEQGWSEPGAEGRALAMARRRRNRRGPDVVRVPAGARPQYVMDAARLCAAGGERIWNGCLAFSALQFFP